MGAGNSTGAKFAGQNPIQVNPQAAARRGPGEAGRVAQDFARRQQAASEQDQMRKRSAVPGRAGINLGPGSARRHTY